MDQIWTYVPTEWMDVKRAIEERKKKNRETLAFDEWDSLCEESDIALEQRDEALNLMRDLGVVLSFPDDHDLKGLGVLNPSWVTGAIYPLLTSKEIAATGGLLKRGEMTALLGDKRRYPVHKHQWLIELMKKFELLFENEGRMLIPSRLPREAPSWAFDAEWDETSTLRLELRYRVLPESVISKFITRWHDRALHSESWWRHGIALSSSDRKASALVRAYVGDPGRLDIRVRGAKSSRQTLIAQLRGDLDRLTSNLGGDLWMVLDGVHAEKYDDLLVLAYDGGQSEIIRVVNGETRKFNLLKHLDLVAPKRSQIGTKVQRQINIYGDASGNAFGPQSSVDMKRNPGVKSND